jgi:aldehyde:ferredoxin oxidoreductase
MTSHRSLKSSEYLNKSLMALSCVLSTLGGYLGNILKVNLTSETIREERLEDDFFRTWLGGYGLGVRVLYDELPARTDPLRPENIVGFTTGLLTGTLTPFSGSFTVVGKSPLTGTWGDSRGGGFFGPELKYAGFDAVFVSGRSKNPVYLWIHDGVAEIRNARAVWGRNVGETEAILKETHGDTRVQVASIGTAGENLSLASAIITDKGRAAGRSGLGAVMGSKHLKAVAVRGTQSIPVANNEKLLELRKKMFATMNGEKKAVTDFIRKYGWCGGTAQSVFSGDCPVKNWGGVGTEDFPTAKKISDDNVIKYDRRPYACFNCPVSCGSIQLIEAGPYAVEGHKPEYETLAALGAMSLIDNVEALIYLNHVCNDYGLDTIEVGSTVAFAIECYENGLITKEDTGGIELTWGNVEAFVEVIKRIARREGFGAVLADGVKLASERIGKGSEQYAMHVGGQALPMHDPRQITNPYNEKNALMYIADATPARHTQRPHEGFALQAAGLCYVIGFFNAYIPAFVNAVTGWDLTADDFIVIGDRIATMRQAFNIREGFTPSDFKYPDRVLGNPPLKSGPLAGVTIENEVQQLVTDYFRSMDWDLKTGKPRKNKLIELGLDDVARDLWE